MAVYEGVLETMSQGEVLSSGGTGGYATDRGVNIARFHTTGVDPQNGWIQRQFVDIGGTRLKNVVVQPYQNALLEEAVGQHIALSVLGPPADSGGRHVVVAIRTARAGVDRPSRNVLLGSSSWLVVKHCVTAPFLFLILLLGSWLVSQVWSPLMEVGAWMAFGATVWWMVVPFFRIANVVKAASALDEAHPATLAPRS
jgi:hypothetical protein